MHTGMPHPPLFCSMWHSSSAPCGTPTNSACAMCLLSTAWHSILLFACQATRQEMLNISGSYCSCRLNTAVHPRQHP